MVTTKFALVSSILGSIQQTRYVDGFNATPKRGRLSGSSQGMDPMELEDPTARIYINQISFQIPPSMVTTKFALVSSLTEPIQQTRHVDGYNTTTKRGQVSGSSQGIDPMELEDPTVRIRINQIFVSNSSFHGHHQICSSLIIN
jgi:hypothetical protein